MTTENYVLPGYYRLEKAIIANYSGKQIDIQNLIPRIDIIESLDNDSIRGSVDVIDMIGFMQDFPLRGEESLQLVLRDPLKTEKIFDLFVYKIDNVQIRPSNDGVTYTMHFTSYARFKAGLRRIVAPYETAISVIAQDIYDKYYGDLRPIVVEPTEGTFRCVIPNYTPMQAMNFLATRAYSTQSPSCSFRFFENSEGFYFVSDEFLVKTALENNGEKIKEYTFDINIDNSGEEFIRQMQNLKEMVNVERADSLGDLYSGAYTNNVVELDLMRKRVVDNRYVYKDERDRYIQFDENSQDVHSEEFINDVFVEENERKFLVVRDYGALGDEPSNVRGEQYLAEITSNRLAYRHHLKHTTVNAVAYGRLDLKVGDVINLLVTEFTSDSDKKSNPQLSGNYLLHTLRHSFNNDVYEIAMQLVKYDWST